MGLKNIRIHPPHVIGFVADIFFSTLESGFIFSGLAVEFAGYVWTVAVSGTKKLRVRKYPDTCGRGLGVNLTISMSIKMAIAEVRNIKHSQNNKHSTKQVQA